MAKAGSRGQVVEMIKSFICLGSTVNQDAMLKMKSKEECQWQVMSSTGSEKRNTKHDIKLTNCDS